MPFSSIKAKMPKLAKKLAKVKKSKIKSMSDLNITNFLGPKTTAQSQAEGRLKVDFSSKTGRKKSVIKAAIKRIKVPKK